MPPTLPIGNTPGRRDIGRLRESSLHAFLKSWYARPGDKLEEPLDGWVIDIVRPGLLIEIQTGSFSHLKPKLDQLLDLHKVHLVHPVAAKRWITRFDNNGIKLSSRKSPYRGKIDHVFAELVYLASYISNPNFSVEVVFIEEDVYYINDGLGSWRRKRWSIANRSVRKVISSRRFSHPDDYRALIPPLLQQPFTIHELANERCISYRLASKLVSTLLKSGVIKRIGKRGRSHLHMLAAVQGESNPP